MWFLWFGRNSYGQDANFETMAESGVKIEDLYKVIGTDVSDFTAVSVDERLPNHFLLIINETTFYVPIVSDNTYSIILVEPIKRLDIEIPRYGDDWEEFNPIDDIAKPKKKQPINKPRR